MKFFSKNTQLLLSIFTVFCIISCNKKRHLVSGQVFIVTKGAQIFPLGLVSIGIASPKDFNSKLDSSLIDFDKTVSEFENSISNFKNEIEGEYFLKSTLWEEVLAEAKNKSLPDYFKVVLSSDEKVRDSFFKSQGVKKLNNRHNIKSFSNYYSQMLKVDALLEERKELELSIEDFKKGHSIILNIRDDFFKTKTNAQGNFSIELEEGDHVIFATSSRLVGVEKENYIWAMEISVKEDIGGLLLSNDNLISANELRLINEKLQ
jgi:hypothetical protein